MSSDEEDYMSDKFLAGCAKDVRPGLIKDRTKQREVEVAAKKVKLDEERRKPSRSNQKERLEEGLSNAIAPDNKGFAMLAKMGYKQGESLGKTSTGIVEPIGIKIKSDRAGLGREAALQDLKERQQSIRRKRLLERSKGVEVTTEEFRRRMTQKNEERLMLSALGKSQRACEDLDKANDVDVPAMPWFWPDRREAKEEDDQQEPESDEEDEDDIVYETFEKVDMLTCYLRFAYNYCHWCGVHYTDLSDLQVNCPGPFKDDH